MPGWGDDDDGPLIPELALTNANALESYIETLVRAGLSGARFAKPATLQELNRLAVMGLEESAGLFRDGPCTIFNSRHVPPPHEEVPNRVAAMCEEVQRRFEVSPVDAAAYGLWGTCWIHPFADGNGRTARAFAYVILSVGILEESTSGADVLPGVYPLPKRLLVNRIRYMRALEVADAAVKTGRADVSDLARLLERCIAAQISEEPLLLDDE